MGAIDLFFEETGRGFPIILLHGYPLDHSIWHPLARLMENYAWLIMPDLRGQGKSPVTEGVYTMRAMADDIKELMDDLKVEQAVLAGHSMGGFVALSFAQNYPEKLAGLALVTSHCFADDEVKEKSRLETASRVEQTGQVDFVMDSMITSLTAIPSIQEELKILIMKANPKGLAGVLRGMAQRTSSCETLQTIKKPAVIIAGGKDKFIPLERSREMAAMIKDEWLEIIPEAGHVPMLETPSVLANILRSFLQKVKLG